MLRAAVLVLLACSACRQEPAPTSDPEGELEFFVRPEKVVEVHDAGDGRHLVGFERSARWFEIHPDETPDAASVLTRARASLESGHPVHVTVRNRPGTPKTKRPGAKGPLPLVVRIADTPDPRAD